MPVTSLRMMAAVGLVAVGTVAEPARPLHAQVLYGTLVGVVRDSSGGAVPGAAVTATNTDNNLVLTAITNNDGNFTIVNVQPGPYNVTVELQGFREFVQTGVPVTANAVSRVDVALEVGAIEETVIVASEARLLQTDSAEVRTELQSKEITELPLSAYRNYQSLINLVPGSTPARFENPLTDSPSRALQTNINGQSIQSNTTNTDGATNVNVWLPHQVMYVSPAETIETVNISTNSFSAEQGMAGGAAVTVVTKSGTNDLRGSVFEFFNNERLNATPFFSPSRPQLNRNIAGGTLGGPIVRNRLFFFGSYEGFFDRGTNFQFLDVPTAAMRAGNFTNARNANGSTQVIYDPLTGTADGFGRQPFPGNAVPASRLSPAAVRVLALYPLPNTTGTLGEEDPARNYIRENREETDRHNFDVKVNWNRTSSHQIWAKYSQMNADVGNLFWLGADDNGKGVTTVYQPTIGHTWTLNQKTVLDSTFGFSRNSQEVQPPGFDRGFFGRDDLRIPGTNGGAGQFARDGRYAGLPRFNTGLSTLGSIDPWYPVFRDDRTYAFKANVSKLAANHELRFGYAGNYLTLDHWQPEVGHPRGIFDFAGTATALRGGQTSNFYNTYAAFLLGLVSTAGKSAQHEQLTALEWQHALYFNDRWAINDRMSLNLGLRYEYYPLMTRKGGRGLERLDLETMDVLIGGGGGNTKDLGVEVSKTAFAPRLGFVYRVNLSTVARVGYGLTYNALPLARPLRGNYPLTIAATHTRNNPWGWVSTLDEGIPEIVGPDLADTGRLPLPPSVAMRTPELDLARGRVHSWNVALERRLPAAISVDVAYVATRGVDGYGDLDINASNTPGGGNQSRPYFSSFGRNIAINSFGPRIETEYHSLQVAINRPFQNGLMLKGAYTLSKAMGETTNGQDGGAGLSWNAPSELHRNWALQPFDRTHNFQLGFLYEIPFNRAGRGLVKAVLGGWQTSGILYAHSNTPFTVTANGAELNMPGNLQTADLVGTPTVLGNIGNAGTYFDPEAWAQPTGVRFGTTSRNSARGPAGWNADLSLFRNFNLGGRRVEFRTEAFNVFNHPIWANPNGDVNSANFMRIFSAAVAPRTVRLGLRLSF